MMQKLTPPEHADEHSPLLEGEYGYNGLFVGVPVKLGAGGIEKIYEVALTADEKTALDKSAASVKELIEVLQQKTGL